MAKNITIKEGSVAKNFTGVEKLSTTQMNSTEKINWIPEDEVLDYVDLKELTVTANGTYHAEDKNCDGFDTVKVNISADVVPQKLIVANGEYDAMEEAGKVGYGHVSVSVPGGGGGPYTVRFFDDNNNLIKTQENVPWGGYASCTQLDGTILNGLYFKGWNPVPKNVQANINCFPVRGDYQIVVGEIQDSWETIIADCGAHYPLGSYKTLVFDIPQHTGWTNPLNNIYWSGQYYSGVRNTPTTISAISIAFHMVKVAEGEDGTTSTWISDNMIDFEDCGLLYYADRNVQTYVEYYNIDGNLNYINTDWDSSSARKWLNEDFFNNLPQVLRDAIKPVNKTYKSHNLAPCYRGTDYRSVQFLDKTSIDEIWIPSSKEMQTLWETAPNYSSGYEASLELQGIDYSAVWMPAYGDYFFTRGVWCYPGQNYSSPNYFKSGENLTPNGYTGKAPIGFCL